MVNIKEEVAKYPEYFGDCRGSVKLDEGKVKRLIDDALYSLEKDPSEVAIIHAGNTYVFAYSVHVEDGGGVRVIVARDYEDMFINNEVFKQEKRVSVENEESNVSGQVDEYETPYEETLSLTKKIESFIDVTLNGTDDEYFEVDDLVNLEQMAEKLSKAIQAKLEAIKG